MSELKAIKKSVRLIDTAVRTCCVISRNITDDAINWSGSLNIMASEYVLVMEENKPDLTENQWNALYELYNGYMPGPDSKQEARLLAWNISEGYEYNEIITEYLGSKEDAAAFITKVKNWSITKQLSVIYHVKKFWTPLPTENQQDVDKEWE